MFHSPKGTIMELDLDFQNIVGLSGGKPVTTSRLMAQRFNKRHDNILQLYQTRIIGRHSPEFIALNFQVVDYIDAKGEARQEIRMTKNGFVAVATKLRGAEEWQERFIAAFDAMAEQLEQLAHNLWTRRMRLETRDATSAAKASFGSSLMLERKKELPALTKERAQLQGEMQPPLPHFH